MDSFLALEQLESFAQLSLAARHALAAVARVIEYDDGQAIMLEGDPAAPAFYVLRGMVRVFRTGMDGREQTVIRLGPGEALNLPAAFVDSDGAPASAVALGPAVLLSIPCAVLRRVASETPEIALVILRDFAVKLHYLTDLARDLGLLTVRARLARFLLNAHGGYSASGGQPNHSSSPVRWTHAEIAAQIGTVREVVSRTLRAFAKEGLIKLDRHRILVLDHKALLDEAEA